MAQRDAAEQGLVLDQPAGRTVGLPVGETDSLFTVGVGEKHADLGALEQRHRVSGMRRRDAVETVARLGELAIRQV